MITLLSAHDLFIIMMHIEVDSIKFYVDGNYVDSIEFVAESSCSYVLYGTGDNMYLESDYDGHELRYYVTL